MEVASRGHEAEAVALKIAVPEWFMERTACNSGGHLNATDAMQIEKKKFLNLNATDMMQIILHNFLSLEGDARRRRIGLWGR